MKGYWFPKDLITYDAVLDIISKTLLIPKFQILKIGFSNNKNIKFKLKDRVGIVPTDYKDTYAQIYDLVEGFMIKDLPVSIEHAQEVDEDLQNIKSAFLVEAIELKNSCKLIDSINITIDSKVFIKIEILSNDILYKKRFRYVELKENPDLSLKKIFEKSFFTDICKTEKDNYLKMLKNSKSYGTFEYKDLKVKYSINDGFNLSYVYIYPKHLSMEWTKWTVVDTGIKLFKKDSFFDKESCSFKFPTLNIYKDKIIEIIDDYLKKNDYEIRINTKLTLPEEIDSKSIYSILTNNKNYQYIDMLTNEFKNLHINNFISINVNTQIISNIINCAKLTYEKLDDGQYVLNKVSFYGDEQLGDAVKKYEKKKSSFIKAVKLVKTIKEFENINFDKYKLFDDKVELEFKQKSKKLKITHKIKINLEMPDWKTSYSDWKKAVLNIQKTIIKEVNEKEKQALVDKMKKEKEEEKQRKVKKKEVVKLLNNKSHDLYNNPIYLGILDCFLNNKQYITAKMIVNALRSKTKSTAINASNSDCIFNKFYVLWNEIK